MLLGVNIAIRNSSSRSSQTPVSNSRIDNRNSMDDAAAVMQNLDRGNVVIARCRHVLIRFTKLYDALGKNSQRTATTFVSDFVL